MWSTFYYHAFDFSVAFDKFKRALIIYVVFLLVLSYLYYYRMYAQAHDELLRALMTFKVETQVLSDTKE